MGSVKKEGEKSDDKLEIDREEKEKILNEENKGQDKIVESDATEGSKIKAEFKEGMEVKPRKIPIGGIQMPGFFMRSRSKEKCRDGDSDTHENDVEGTELLTQNEQEKDIPDDSLMNQSKVKLPIRKKADDVEKGSEQGEKQKLFDRLCKPLVSIFPKNKKDAEKNLENQTAGLASVETLDDNDKSADQKEDGNDAAEGAKQNESCMSACIGKLKAYHLVISALLIFLILVSAIVFFTITGDDIIPSATVIEGNVVEAITSCGKVEGIHHDDAVAFRGIPYARPPLGDLRFKPAQPLSNIVYCWNDTLKAHNTTPPCLQILGNGTVTGMEDCLTLDVVTPYVRYHNPLPVIVLIGAETLIGASPAKMRPSTRYARSKDVVFVRPNFRLGVLGFLAARSLREYPGMGGNYALSDIKLALRWVQLNIEHFGGNPKAVTVLGHRAGASLVTALTTTRNATRYFARAWATSPSAIYPTKSLVESERESESFLKAVQCKSADAQCLRELNATTLMTSIDDTWRQPQPDLPSKSENPHERHQWMVVDGKIINESPYEVWSREEGLSAQLVLGVTAHSLATEKLLLKYTEWNEELVTKHVKESILGDSKLADEALKLYPKTYKGLSAMISDLRSVCPLYQLYKNMHNTSFYVVTQTRGSQDVSDVDSDIDAILGRYEPKTPEQRRYFSAIQQLFYHYVWQGEIDERAISSMLIVDQDVRAEPSYPNCDFWIKNNMTIFAQLD